jgi:hypothetical protein
MKFVILAEEGVRDLFQPSQIWNDPSIVFASLGDMAGFEAQLVSNRLSSARSSLVNGFVIGAILRDIADEPHEAVIERLPRIIHVKFAEGFLFRVGDGTTIDDLTVWLLARQRLVAATFAQFYGQSDLALAELRRTLLDTQGALNAADKALSQVGYPNLYLVDEIASSDFSRALSELGASPLFSVSQTTWRDLKSFKRLDLHLSPVSASGSIVVKVTGAYSSRQIASWKRQAASLTSGWNAFDRGTEFTGLDEPIDITVSCFNESGAPSIGFGEPIADRTATASLADGSRLDRPLSFRMWRNVFSSVTEESGRAHFDATALDGLDLLPVSGLLSLIAYCDGPPHAEPENHVKWKNDVSAALVHPAGHRPMIGVLRAVAAERLRRMSVAVCLDHPDAAPTEFAIVALPPNTDIKSGFVARLSHRFGQTQKSKLVSFLMKKARWLPLEAGGRGEIAYEFDEPYTGPIDIFFMTRNVSDENAYSWALFSGLSLDPGKGDAEPK